MRLPLSSSVHMKRGQDEEEKEEEELLLPTREEERQEKRTEKKEEDGDQAKRMRRRISRVTRMTTWWNRIKKTFLSRKPSRLSKASCPSTNSSARTSDNSQPVFSSLSVLKFFFLVLSRHHTRERQKDWYREEREGGGDRNGNLSARVSSLPTAYPCTQPHLHMVFSVECNRSCLCSLETLRRGSVW